MRGGDSEAERIRERGVKVTGVGQVVEGRGLVETPHLDGPFDRRAAAAKRKRSIRRTGDWHHAGTDVLNQPVRQITCATPIKANLGVPELCGIATGLDKTTPGGKPLSLQNLCLNDEMRTSSHPLIFGDRPVIFAYSAHARGDVDRTRSGQQIVRRQQLLVTG